MNIVMISMFIGCFIGMAFGIFVSKLFIRRFSLNKYTQIAAQAFCYISLAPSVLLALSIGGMFGGGIGENMFGDSGIAIGFIVGISMATVLLVVGVTLLTLAISGVIYRSYMHVIRST